MANIADIVESAISDKFDNFMEICRFIEDQKNELDSLLDDLKNEKVKVSNDRMIDSLEMSVGCLDEIAKTLYSEATEL